MMIKRCCLILLACVGLSGTAHAIDIQVVESDSGVTAWLVEEHSQPIVTLSAAFRGGSTMDPEGKEGLARMVSATLDEGAGDLDAAAFQQKLQDQAIHLSFSASSDQLSVDLRTLSEFSGEAFKLLGLAVTEPRFDEQAVERIRSQMLAGLRQNAEEPSWIAARAWEKAYFDGHPYGRANEGTLETVPNIEIPDLRKFVDGRLARDNLYVAVVGDVTPEDLKTYLDTAFGDLPEKSVPYELSRPAETGEGQTIRIERDIPQAVVRFGQKGLLRDDPQWYAAYIMNYILGGGGFASRLTDVVREEHGLAYSVGTSLVPYEYAGLLLGSVATDSTAVAQSKALIEEQVAAMATGDVTAEELADAKSYLTGSYPLNFDTSRKIAGQLLGVQLEGLGLDYIDERNSLIENVTLDEVNAVAQDLLKPEELIWVIVGGPQEEQ